MSSPNTNNKNIASRGNGQFPPANGPPNKKSKLDTAVAAAAASDTVAEQWKPYEKLDPTKCIEKNDIWMQILGFVGPGHYIYLALVSKKFKELYKASFDAPAAQCIHDLPKVRYRYHGPSRPATSNDTFYRVAFSSVALAKYWKDSAAEDLPLRQFCQVCQTVATYGNLDVLKWSQEPEQSYPWGARTCALAAKNGHLEVLKYLHENGCPWDPSTSAMAAFGGHLEYLVYAHEKGCEWIATTCSWAAKNGHIDCLKYAHEKGCPWSFMTCQQLAAKNGHLECLKYAHEKGCQWNEITCENAARNGHLHCLKYAHENGCEWNRQIWYPAVANGHLHILQYIYDQEGGIGNEEAVRREAQRCRHQHILEWLAENQQEDD